MNYKFEAEKIIKEVIEKCSLTKGDILVIGFSSSEVVGSKIGTNSNIDVASEIFNAIYNILRKKSTAESECVRVFFYCMERKMKRFGNYSEMSSA